MPPKKPVKTPTTKKAKAPSSKTTTSPSRAHKAPAKSPSSPKRSRDSESDDDYADDKSKNNKSRAKKKKVTIAVEEEEEEADDGDEEGITEDQEDGKLGSQEDSQDGHHETSSLVGGSQMDALITRLKAKEPKKTKSKKAKDTDHGGLAAYFTDIRERMDAIQAGPKGIQARQKIIQTFRSNVEDLDKQKERFRKGCAVANQERYAILQNTTTAEEAFNSRQAHLDALQGGIDRFPTIHAKKEAGLNNIADTHEEEKREIEAQSRAVKDAKTLIRDARRFLRSASHSASTKRISVE